MVLRSVGRMNNEESAAPTAAAPAPAADENNENYACPICYDPIDVASGEVRLSCSHRFHLSCVGTWIARGNTNCPYCRSDLAETEQFVAPVPDQVLLPAVWHFPPLQQQMEIFPNALINNINDNLINNINDNLINDFVNNLINPIVPIIGNQNVANNLINNYNELIHNYNLNNNYTLLYNNMVYDHDNQINQTVLFPQFPPGLLAAPVQQEMEGLQG